MKALFRVEAGPGVGLGHLRRSLSLGAALRQKGVTAHFLLNAGRVSSDWMRHQGVSFSCLPKGGRFDARDLRQTLETARKSEARVLVVDFHEVPAGYLETLRAEGFFVVYRDDLCNAPFSSQIILNGNADAAELPYPLSQEGVLFLLGPRYAVLAPEFWERPRRVVSAKVQRILVILGGTDPFGLMPRILRLLEEIAPGAEITAILGPYAENREEIRAAASGMPSVNLVDAPPCLAPWIAKADLCVTAAGQTLYELACFGCPAMAIQVAPNQKGQMEALEKVGCVEIIGEADRKDLLDRLRLSLRPILQGDASIRARMTEAGLARVDGRGALRIASEIMERAFGRGSLLSGGATA